MDEVARNRTNFRDANHIMFLMGQDFTYQNAAIYFKNLDKLMKHMNERSEETKVKLFYSTPGCYVKALNEAGGKWSAKTDDFFPHANGKPVG